MGPAAFNQPDGKAHVMYMLTANKPDPCRLSPDEPSSHGGPAAACMHVETKLAISVACEAQAGPWTVPKQGGERCPNNHDLKAATNRADGTAAAGRQNVTNAWRNARLRPLGWFSVSIDHRVGTANSWSRTG
ncbi:hypothetical protein M8818_001028 [Zalaria obscura]|uniref:Uncharacterized protein n=1 Tax=Zalaria obscura TaxID=2024903 RepID=A0ACC3SPH9_9PEZI